MGEKIYKLRKLAGYSQEELADKLGVSRQTIYKWETSIVQPNVENIVALCKIFNVSKEYFYIEKIQSENSDIYNEIAVSTDKKKKYTGFIISISCMFIVLFFLTCLTVISGFMTLTTNTGDAHELSINFDYSVFIIFLVLSILVFILNTILIILFVKKKRKYNVNKK